MSNRSLVLACLRELDIAEAVVSLDGSGDSGDASFDHCVTRAGATLYHLPDMIVGLNGAGGPAGLCDLLLDVAENEPDGDWVNNEGGYGTVTFSPFEENEEDQVCCDMTYREEYENDEPDFEDDEDEPPDDKGADTELDKAEEDDVALPIVTHTAGGTP